VIVPDVNLLLYAIDEGAAPHRRAADWWRECLRGPEPIGLPWSTILAVVRLTTNPRIFASPLSTEAALDLMEGWLSLRHVVALEPTRDHLSIVRRLLDTTGTGGNLVTDAHLAALAMGHRAVLCSADHDFARFAGLTWRNPVATA
jgi:toxin-antitoxin system PIN domain toxin